VLFCASFKTAYMKQLIFATKQDWTGLILRFTLALILFPHGAQKTFGWFGGPGFSNEMQHFTEHMHLPVWLGFLVIVIEFLAPLFFLAGLASRLWAIATMGLFAGIIFTAHLEYGFFMNWFGNQKGEGFEYHLLVIGLCLALLVQGSGLFALDRLIGKSDKEA
jgi:putative oxidoreductase